jgi:predicted outer membrane protein
MLKGLLAGAVVAGLMGAPAFAGQQPTTAEKADKTMAGKTPDESFVMKAAMGGMAEVDLGKLAVEKATSDEVKKFGQLMRRPCTTNSPSCLAPRSIAPTCRRWSPTTRKT